MKLKQPMAFVKLATACIIWIVALACLVIPTKVLAEPTITRLGTGFNTPKSVAVDSSGNIYLLEYIDPTSIKRMDPSGENIVNLYTADRPIHQIALDSSGNIYGPVGGHKYIRKMDANGDFDENIYADLNVAEGITIDSSGNIYVADTDNHVVKKIDKWGNVEILGSGFSHPYGIAIDSSSNIYVTSIDLTLKKIDASGTNTQTLATGFGSPRGLEVDSYGRIYVTDEYHSTLKILNASGELLTSLDKYFDSPFDVALDSSGNIYVADYIDSVITKITVDKAASATTVAHTLEPMAGAVNTVTLTVNNSLDITDLSFNGLKNVTISGVQAAPNGTFGSFNGVELDASSLTGQTISVPFTDGVASTSLELNRAESQTISFSIEGLITPATNDLSITPVHEVATSMAIAQDIDAPLVNGGSFASQPVVLLQDTYHNICINNSTTQITASKKDMSNWSLEGTTTLTVANGKASFTDLKAINYPQIDHAQLAFNAPGLTEIVSRTVTLPIASYTVFYHRGDHGSISSSQEMVGYNNSPANIPLVTAEAGYEFAHWSSDAGVTKLSPAQVALQAVTGNISYTAYYNQVATAEASTETPSVGADNTITLTVLTPSGTIDTSFTGSKNVTISGVEVAPNGTYGSFSGVSLDASSATGQVISITFANGVARSALSLNKAGTQTIAFNIEGLSTPTTNNLSVSPTHGAASSLILTQAITSPITNGSSFADQPILTLLDAYENICNQDNSTEVTVSKNDEGIWSLVGTTTMTAVDGAVSFTDLKAINDPRIEGAQLAFTLGSIEVTSNTVTLPIASYTVYYQRGDHGTISSSSETVDYNSSPVMIPTVTSAEGYAFAYWSSDAGVTKLSPAQLATERILATTTYAAYYTQIPIIESVVTGSRYVDLQWTAVTGATNYKIYQSTIPSSFGAALGTVSDSVFSYRAAELTNGTTYYFTITAVTSAGETPKSAEVSAMPLAGALIVADPNIITFSSYNDGGTIINFDSLNDVGIDSNGNIYVLDHTKITVINSDGDYVRTLGLDLGLSTPMDIALDNSDNIYIADTVNSEIKVINPAGVLQATWGFGGGYYRGVAVEPDGSFIYVADTDSDAIKKIDTSEGTMTELGAGKFSQPMRVALDSEGNIYVTEWGNSQLKKIDASENVVTVGSGFNNPQGLVIDSSGHIYVSDSTNSAVKMIEGGQGDIINLGSGYDSPRGIEIDSKGNIYVADQGNKSIKKLILEDAFSAVITASTLEPTAGSSNPITFTVKNSFGLTDTSFNDPKNVTISGVEEASNDTYGHFNGVVLDSGSITGQTISVTFTNGVAVAALGLNNAESQIITVSVEGLINAATNKLNITPVHNEVASMALVQNILAPSVNGGSFEQQPIVLLQDAYANLCTRDNSTQITVSKKDSGDWSLSGTTTMTSAGGTIIFSDLKAQNKPEIEGAQVAFNSEVLELMEVTSLEVTLPSAASYNVTYQEGDHGTLSSSSESVYINDSPANVPTVTAEAGYEFDYWSSDSGVNKLTPEQVALQTITADITYTAYYTVSIFPSAPTGVKAIAGNRQAKVSFLAPVADGGAAITSYIVTASPGGATASGTGSPIAISGLSNGITYTFRVKAVNSNGEGPASVPSNGVRPYKPSSSSSSKPVITPEPEETHTTVLVNGSPHSLVTETIVKDGSKTTVIVTIDDEKVEEALQEEDGNTTFSITIYDTADTAVTQLSHQTVQNMTEKKAILEIKTQNITFTLPASEINMAEITKELGISAADTVLSIEISVPTADIIRMIEDTVSDNNFQLIVSPVNLIITVTSGDKTIEISNLNGYVERMIALPADIDPNLVYTAIVLNADGSFTPVPTAIALIDGQYYAKISSLTNGVFSVIGNKVAFKDIENHWAQKTINNLGSRLIFSGVGDNRFEPDREITRAEFVAFLVRALGIRGSGEDIFEDVIPTDWYYNTVSIAYTHGIISGYANSEFRPKDKITREQAMAIITRAMEMTKLASDLNTDEIEELLASFEDRDQVADYARNSVATCVKSGIVTGRNGKLLAPKDNITRAEAVSMVNRLLEKSALIS